jgi:hypothetical protein
MGAIALLLLAVAVPLTSASTTPVTRHVDGSVVVSESASRTWLARFEVRTTPAGDVQFGYLELYGIGAEQRGEIHEFTVDHIDYWKTSSGAQAATLYEQECIIVPPTPCFSGQYLVSDGSKVGQADTFMPQLGWTVQSGNISIYSTGGQNGQ